MENISFRDYKLDDELLRSITILGYEKPTRVQEEVIPIALKGKDIVVRSQTGSGKTAAFGIPLAQLVDWDENKPQALVLTPTRELAMQVREDIFNIGRFRVLKVAAVYGQAPIYHQERELKQKTHVVVGTPGRLIDHMERGSLDLSQIRYLVIDEADEMFNMGFIDEIEKIIRKTPKNRTTMLFSATMPDDIELLSSKHMRDPLYVEIEGQRPTVDKIDQELYELDRLDKIDLLEEVTIIENPDSCIVFCNTREMVDQVHVELRRRDYTCDKIHGGMEQRDRIRVMEDFKQGYFRYLIATDVAARGIDVDNITHVINYDIPRESESYVHRIGRTGRAGRRGKGISLLSRGEEGYLKDIVKYIGKDIKKKEIPDKGLVESLREEFYEKMKRKVEIKDPKGEGLNKGIMKLHINAGRKTKMRPVDIVGTLCNLEGMTADDIGIINVQDISTFVEILNGKGERVLEQLQTTTIKGRLRNVNKANE